jgi:hypothetical protein
VRARPWCVCVCVCASMVSRWCGDGPLPTLRRACVACLGEQHVATPTHERTKAQQQAAWAKVEDFLHSQALPGREGARPPSRLEE